MGKFNFCVISIHSNKNDNSATLNLEYTNYCIFHVFVTVSIFMKKFLHCYILKVCVSEHVVMITLSCDVVFVVNVG